jgi:hypothetical protein
MSAKLSPELKIVIDLFTPDVLGVLWITKQELNRDLPAFSEFNYLFDGLISQYLYGQVEDKHLERKNTFFTKNFDKLVFLVHTRFTENSKNELFEHIDILHYNQTEERRKILILDTETSGLIKFLKDKYPQFIFQEINIQS